MTTTKLTPIRFENGNWEGHLTSTTQPEVEVLYLGETVPGTEITGQEDGWILRVPVPHSALSEGVHSFVISEVVSGEKLGSFSVIAGAPAEGNLLAEIDLLRAELDMLKRAFRRLNRTDL